MTEWEGMPMCRGRIAIICLLFAARPAAAQLVTYNPSGLSGTNTQLGVTTSNANVSATAIARGSGLTSVSGSASFPAQSWNEGTSFSTALSNSNYFTFTIAPAANYSMAFTSLSAGFN